MEQEWAVYSFDYPLELITYESLPRNFLFLILFDSSMMSIQFSIYNFSASLETFKGCVRYIFASFFFKSKREHLSN